MGRSEIWLRFFSEELWELFFRRIDDVLHGHILCQHGRNSRIIDAAEGLVITLKELVFAELQVQVGDHVGLLPDDAFGQV